MRIEDKGVIKGGVFVTSREAKHFFRIFNGFGVSKDILARLSDSGVERIRFCFHSPFGGLVFYEIGLVDFLVHAREWVDESQGFRDEQLICNKDLMAERSFGVGLNEGGGY